MLVCVDIFGISSQSVYIMIEMTYNVSNSTGVLDSTVTCLFCSVVSVSSALDHGAVHLSKAPGSNRPNKSISSMAFANSDSWPFCDFDYEYMKLMANRGLYCQRKNDILVSLKYCCLVSL